MTTTTPAEVQTEDVERRIRRQGRDTKGAAFRYGLLAALVVSVLLLVVLVAEMLNEGSSVLRSRPADFLLSDSRPDPATAGAWQGIRGTLQLVTIVALCAFPLGVGAAVYLEEYESDSRFARIVNINVRNLAGVPSIVYGLLGLSVFVYSLAFVTGGRTVISGGLTLSVLVLPIVIITAQEALRAVPAGIREGALALGATPWETIRHHVLPAAFPGILTGTVLSLARAAGEAAPLLVVGANVGVFFAGAQGFFEQLVEGRFTAMPMLVYSWARQPGQEWTGLTGAAGFVLLMLIVVVNGLAIFARNKFEQKW